MEKRVSFNINAELYENRFGELAIKFAGEKVFADVGGAKSDFLTDALNVLRDGSHPRGWRDIPPHQLLYGQDWRCICSMGYIDGDENQPALELEVSSAQMGERARSYIGEIAS
jgi:hypothetical protein